MVTGTCYVVARRLKVTLPIRYAVLDHEEPLPHPACDQVQ
jgi:hypothetical protein